MVLLEHAKKELELAGFLDIDSEYNGEIGEAVLELIKAFSKQDHQASSASLVRFLFDKLSAFENLTEITDNPDDWMIISTSTEKQLWKCKRNPSYVSTDGGKTYYSIDDPLINVKLSRNYKVYNPRSKGKKKRKLKKVNRK